MVCWNLAHRLLLHTAHCLSVNRCTWLIHPYLALARTLHVLAHICTNTNFLFCSCSFHPKPDTFIFGTTRQTQKPTFVFCYCVINPKCLTYERKAYFSPYITFCKQTSPHAFSNILFFLGCGWEGENMIDKTNNLQVFVSQHLVVFLSLSLWLLYTSSGHIIVKKCIF